MIMIYLQKIFLENISIFVLVFRELRTPLRFNLIFTVPFFGPNKRFTSWKDGRQWNYVKKSKKSGSSSLDFIQILYQSPSLKVNFQLKGKLKDCQLHVVTIIPEGPQKNLILEELRKSITLYITKTYQYKQNSHQWGFTQDQ